MQQQESVYTHAIASQGAGMMSTMLFTPLEVVRVRFMSQDGTSLRTHGGVRYASISQAMTEMYSKEGMHVFFRGAHVAAVASGFSHGVYMLCFRSLSHRVSDIIMLNNKDESQHQHHSSSENTPAVDPRHLPFKYSFLCSVAANAVVAYASNPLWLVKTRLQLDDVAARQQPKGDTRSGGGTSSMSSAIACVKRSLQADGPTVFWRGTTAQLMLSVPSSLHLPIYELLLRWSDAPISRFRRNKASTTTTTTTPQDIADEKQQGKNFGHFVTAVVCCNVTAKSIVTFICHPFTLLRTRLQDVKARRGELQYRNVGDVFIACLHQSGTRGFWRGLSPSLLQVVPRSMVQIFLYELAVRHMA